MALFAMAYDERYLHVSTILSRQKQSSETAAAASADQQYLLREP